MDSNDNNCQSTPDIGQQQQQPPRQPSNSDLSNDTNANSASNSETVSTNDQETGHQTSSSTDPQATNKQRNHEHLFSPKNWGDTPVRQDTPWELPPSPNTNSSSTSSGGVSAGTAPTLPPGISQSGDSFRAGNAVNDFHGQAMVNNFGIDNMSANGLANTLNHMNLGGSSVTHPASRFDQPWRAPVAKQHQSAISSASPFANPNLMNPTPGGLPKSILNSGGGGNGNGGAQSFAVGVQQGGASAGDFTRAPGPTSSMMDNKSKPFGVSNRSSTWSAFGSPAPNDSDAEWPKSSGISSGNSNQPSNTFDLVQDFEAGKSWTSSMLMKSLDEGPTLGTAPTPLGPYAGSYATSSKSPTEIQNDSSGIGTWSPVVKGGRPGSKWDGDGPDNGRSDNGRFDDGTSIWGSPAQSKVAGIDWADKSSDSNGNGDKSRSMAGNNQPYRSQQSTSSASLLMSNTIPSSQHGRNQPAIKQPISSHNFDQSNALPSQANQPNRGLGLSSGNVPSTQQLRHMIQQIQLAVQAGHLNPQILNQPLSPVTLQLLYQLLQQIKVLHQYQMQASQQLGRSGNHPAATVNVQINKTKQNIMNLQNQIAAQQAVYLRQTQAHNMSSRQQSMSSLAAGGVGAGTATTLPPGISQSGDSIRAANAFNDLHNQVMVNNFGIDNMSPNGLANTLNHMNLGGSSVTHPASRFDQPWRAPVAKQHQSAISSASPFANPNLMNPTPGGLPKSILNSGGGGNGNGGAQSFAVGVQQGGASAGDFTRAPGPTSSMMDNKSKPFGVSNRSSTWSAFGSPAPNDSDAEWPKSSGISSGNSNQQSNAFDLVPEFEPGKPWRGSMLMKSVEDDPTMTPGSMARALAPQRKTIWSDEIL